MIRVMVVRVEGYADTADTWAQMIRDEGYDVTVSGPDDGGPDLDAIVEQTLAEEVDVVVCPGAEHDWRHDLKKRLHDSDIGVSPPQCDGADLFDWVVKRETSGAASVSEPGD